MGMRRIKPNGISRLFVPRREFSTHRPRGARRSRASRRRRRVGFVVTGDRKLLAVRRHGGVLVVPPRAFLAVLDA
jgi:hypothetical protein